jgi:hypothetical protein
MPVYIIVSSEKGKLPPYSVKKSFADIIFSADIRQECVVKLPAQKMVTADSYEPTLTHAPIKG